MPATTPTHAESGPRLPRPGRPHVPNVVENGRTNTIMHDGINFRIPAQRQPDPDHQPWCVNHLDDDQGPGTCMSSDIVLPSQIVGLTFRPDEGVRINLCTGDRIEVLHPDEVKQRAVAMLAQVAVADAYASVSGVTA